MRPEDVRWIADWTKSDKPCLARVVGAMCATQFIAREVHDVQGYEPITDRKHFRSDTWSIFGTQVEAVEWLFGRACTERDHHMAETDRMQSLMNRMRFSLEDLRAKQQSK